MFLGITNYGIKLYTFSKPEIVKYFIMSYCIKKRETGELYRLLIVFFYKN